MYNLNDYELLYMIRENDEYAYSLMIQKYIALIMSKVKSFRIEEEEARQEGIIVLSNAIRTYDEKYNKTFTRYFEKLLINRFINLKKEEKRIYQFDEEVYMRNSYVLEEIEIEFETNKLKEKLSQIEKRIYNDYFIDNCSIEYISNKYDISVKRLYLIIREIRKKMKKNMI